MYMNITIVYLPATFAKNATFHLNHLYSDVGVGAQGCLAISVSLNKAQRHAPVTLSALLWPMGVVRSFGAQGCLQQISSVLFFV